MSETGFQLELSRHFPDLFAYSAARAVAAAKKVEPRALRQIEKHFTLGGEPLSTNELAKMFASYHNETREQVLARVRLSLENYWVKAGFLPEEQS